MQQIRYLSDMKTPSGLINQKIEIYSDADIDNDSGGVNPNAVAYWATSAATKPITVQRANLQGIITFEAAIEFKVRDRIDKVVTEEMLLKYRGIFYTILSAIPDLVNVEMLVIRAITKYYPRRNYENPNLRAYYWLSDNNDPLTEEEILTKDFVLFSAGQSFTLPFNSANQYKFVNMAYLDTEPTKNHYENQSQAGDEGTIGTYAGDLMGIAIETGDLKQHNGGYPLISSSNYLIHTE